MSVSSAAVKEIAKERLKNNYSKTFVASLGVIFAWLISINIASILSAVTGDIIAIIIAVCLNVFLIAPLGLGLLKYIWKISLGVADGPIAIFYWFGNKKLYVKSLKFILNFALKLLLWLTVLNIPSFLLLAFSKTFFFELFNIAPPVWTASLSYYGEILSSVSFVAVFFIMLKFYMAPVLFIADENANVEECMYNSSVISRKTSFDFISLIFNQAHIVLLSLLVLPMPFTLPYLLSYYVTHTRFAVEEYNLHIKNIKFANAGVFNE